MSRHFLLWLTIPVLLVFTSGTMAQPMPEVARKAACAMCHKVDGKLIGPAFVWIAYKYRSNREAGRQAIINQIIKGGQGKWTRYTGGALMPPYDTTTTEAQRNELADFILSLEPVSPPEL